MAVITDYAFQELNDGSGRGRIADNNQSEAYRVFKIAWADLNGFMFALKGGWKKINDTTWQYFAPSYHPDWPQMACKTVEYEGIGLSSQNATTKQSSWEYAKITATYNIPTLDVGSGDPTKIVEEEFDFGLDTVSVAGGTLKAAGGADIDTPMSILIPTLTYTVRMPNLPQLPGGNISVVMGLLGRMNSGSFGGADTGRMIFLGMRARRTGIIALDTPVVAGSNALDTAKRWDVELKFAYRDAHRWDELPLPGGSWTAIQYSGGTTPLYDSGNLNVLLPNGV